MHQAYNNPLIFISSRCAEIKKGDSLVPFMVAVLSNKPSATHDTSYNLRALMSTEKNVLGRKQLCHCWWECSQFTRGIMRWADPAITGPALDRQYLYFFSPFSVAFCGNAFFLTAFFPRAGAFTSRSKVSSIMDTGALSPFLLPTLIILV